MSDLIAIGRNGYAYQIAQVYAVRAEKDKAFEWLQISFDTHDGGTLGFAGRSRLAGFARRSPLQAIARKTRFAHAVMSEKPSFFAELKRRNVYKVAVAYAVIAWLLIQAASILFPTFEAPPWVMKVFVVIVAAGFAWR